jgi:gliding motility-associated-like protein
MTVTVDQPDPLISTISSISPVKCHGQSNGQATASTTGGTPSYSYQWSDAETTNPATHLPAGVDSVIVTDHNGCKTTAIEIITQPTQLGIALISDSVLCYGGTTGGITAHDTGGTPTYQYLWSNGQTGQNLINVGTGLYCVTLTDHNGCTDAACDEVLQPSKLTYNVAAGGTDTVLLCGGPGTNIGSISINVVGGTYPWNYIWSNGDSTQNIMNLSGGIYTITITDHKGCTLVRTFYISQPSPLHIYIDSLDALCRDSCDGEVTSAVTGGTPFSTGNYTYLWSNGHTTENIDTLCHGIYDLTVTDSNGCQKVLAIHVGIKTNVFASFTTSPNSGYVPLNVNFFYNGTHSSSNIYFWTFGDGSIDTTANPPPHIYNAASDTTFKVCLQVSDSACKYDTCELVKVEIHSMIIAPNVFTPNGDGKNDEFMVQDTAIATFDCVIFNRWGNKIYEWSDVHKGWGGKTESGAEASDGTYYYIITAKGYDDVKYNLHGAVMLLRGK